MTAATITKESDNLLDLLLSATEDLSTEEAYLIFNALGPKLAKLSQAMHKDMSIEGLRRVQGRINDRASR